MRKKILLTTIIIICIISSIFTLSACDERADDIVFGTVLSVYVKGPNRGLKKLVQDIPQYINDLEPILSASRKYPDSDINKINRADVGVSVKVHDVTCEVLKAAEKAYDLTYGFFDPSVYPLVKLWKFDSDSFVQVTNYERPTDAQIIATRKKVGLYKCFKIDYENKTVTKNIAGAQLDLGGVAKGYAVDKAKDLVSGDFEALLNLGGDISVINKSYDVCVANPNKRAVRYATVASFTAESGECVATSGGYERYYKVAEEGKNNYTYYHHIINPRTGMPADFKYKTESGKDATLMSATVICENGALGDALSTGLMLIGHDEAIKLINEIITIDKIDISAVLVSSIEGHDRLTVEKIGSKFI